MNSTTHLLYLCPLVLLPTNKGLVTITEAKAVFGHGSDSFVQNIDRESAELDTEETRVGLFQTSKDGTYRDWFGSLGVDLCLLFLTKRQIWQFCQTHREHLRVGGQGTFFLFEREGKPVVAEVNMCDGKLHFYECNLDHNLVLLDDLLRLVVKEQTA